MSNSAERMRRKRERERQERLARERTKNPTAGMNEQEIRDYWGYDASEKRTQAQRQADADSITGKYVATTPAQLELREEWYRVGKSLRAGPAPELGDAFPVALAGWYDGVLQGQANVIERHRRAQRAYVPPDYK